jgi:outer membrane protein OmpA-like peptidoglycan-associated protein
MDRNNRSRQTKQQRVTASRPLSSPENAATVSQQAENSEAMQRAKAGVTSKIRARDVLSLQSSLGNKGVRRLLGASAGYAVQGHWLPGEPEEVQAMPQVQRRAVPLAQKVQAHWLPGEPEEMQAKPQVQRRRQPAFGNPAYRVGTPGTAGLQRNLWANQIHPPLVQRQEKGGAGVKEAPAAKEAPKAVVSFGALSFAPHEIPADGKTTSQANVKVAPPGRTIDWSIDGDDYGTTVSKSGLVTPGNDTKGQESVTLKVKAADEEQPEVFSLGKLTLWDAKFYQAKEDFPKFVAGSYTFPKFVKGFNGKFDVAYQPAANLLNINVKVKFNFIDDPVPEPGLFNLFGLLHKESKAAVQARHKAYRDNFMKVITSQWSGRYQMQNVREPKSIWGKLNPVDTKVNVLEVDADQHFVIEVHQKKTGTANVYMGTTQLYKGDDVPSPAFNNKAATAKGELTRVRRNTPTPILFGNNSFDVPADAQGKLQFLGTYLSRINNPKFEINIVGHASATGTEKHNKALSAKRADKVAAVLQAAGAGHHKISASGVGMAGADKSDQWRKVEISSDVPAGWQNIQDVTAHEFGHMLGLGDEYFMAGMPEATHYDLVKKAFGVDYAEQVAKRGDTFSASIMERGDDVRVQHYVTIWSALCETTMKAPQPDPKFGYDDWKLVG